MVLLHTADWHLGQTFFDYDRQEEHHIFLQWLMARIRELQVDVLLMAGDIFDTSNPSAESQKMYYRFLHDVTVENPDLQIIIIAGNHDSAARLEAPNPLLETFNVTVRGIVKRTDDGKIDVEHLIIPLRKGGYCLAIPYLRQGDCPDAETYTQGVKKMYETVIEHVLAKPINLSSQPIIAMGHLQATGAEISENDRSERTMIGGLEAISPTSFTDDITYTALGHLHRAQRVSGRENVRYAGAPLPMSFAEKNNRQGVTLITMAEETIIKRLEFKAPVQLLSIPDQAQPLAAVLKSIEQLPQGEITAQSPYLEIKILITEPEPSLKYQIEEALKGKSVRLTRIVVTTPHKSIDQPIMTYDDLQTIHPIKMATDIFQRKYGGEPMPENMKTLLQNVIDTIER